MTVSNILWAWVAVLVVGGLIGLIKAGSKASIIASVVLAAPVAAVALGKLPIQVAWVVMGLVAVLFGFRYAKSKKPMPAIPLIVASVVALVLVVIKSR